VIRRLTAGLLCAAPPALFAGVGAWTTNGLPGYVSSGGLVADSAIPGSLYAGTGTGLAKSTDNGVAWSNLVVGSTSSATPLAAANGTVYASAGGCDLSLSCTTTVYKSADGGQQWQMIIRGSVFGVGLRFGISIDPRSASTLYLTSTYTDPHQFVSSGLSRSTDGGLTWTNINPPFPINTIRALAIDPSNPATLYFADAPEGNQPDPPPPSHVFKSIDSGSTWTILTSSIGIVSALALDPLSPATLYAATSDGVFRSLDAGRTFLIVNSMILASVVVNPTHEDRLYGTGFANGGGGVFASTDAGATWSAMNTGLTDLSAGALAISADGTVLHVATLTGVFDNELAFPTCPADGHTLCLNDGRFRVTADFQPTPEGPSSPATAVPLTSNTGYFWFFDPSNVEIVTKVLNGCTTNGHHWFFAGGLTNLGVQIRVRDTSSGMEQDYSNSVGRAFAPIQDTTAFAVCP
jgi:hypothetical protein